MMLYALSLLFKSYPLEMDFAFSTLLFGFWLWFCIVILFMEFQKIFDRSLPTSCPNYVSKIL